jgi:hypothetical protein
MAFCHPERSKDLSRQILRSLRSLRMTGLAKFLLIPSTNELLTKTLPDIPGVLGGFKKPAIGKTFYLVPKLQLGSAFIRRSSTTPPS